jgi:hypothetical protein
MSIYRGICVFPPSFITAEFFTEGRTTSVTTAGEYKTEVWESKRKELRTCNGIDLYNIPVSSPRPPTAEAVAAARVGKALWQRAAGSQ